MLPTAEVEFVDNTLTVAFPTLAAPERQYVVYQGQCTGVSFTPKKVFTVDANANFGFPFAPSPAQAVSDYLPEQVNWVVHLHLNTGEVLDLPMGRITNKVTWVNTAAGAVIAQEEIRAAFPATP